MKSVLHLASFTGNIGDNASHIGFRKVLPAIIPGTYTLDQLEIRRFYNKYTLRDKAYFDDSFVSLVNKYDLLMIGGGGFLDFDVKGSASGTTLNMPAGIIDKIKTPIFLSSVGANPRHQVPDENIGRFKSFIEAFTAKSKNFLAVRNDGSKQAIFEYFGSAMADTINEVLDHGFYYENDGSYYKCPSEKYIIINTTEDQVQMINSGGQADTYEQQMWQFITYVMEHTDYDIVFAPHIFSDIRAIQKLLAPIDDFLIRSRIYILPYAQGDFGCNQVFSAYKNAHLVIGMRFHANVCAAALNVPSVALAALNRVQMVYSQIGLGDFVVSIDDNLSGQLVKQLGDIHADTSLQSRQTMSELLKEKKMQSLHKYSTYFQNIFQ